VPRLVEDFVRLCERETGKRVRGISARALRALTDYAWPGNVRELEHEVRRLVYLCPDHEVIDLALLSPQILARAGATASPPDAGAVDGSLDLEANVAALERRLIGEALARAGGNRTEAARLLGISRNGLALKMQRLGVSS
jgi:DNA-binding NtrC family response regulator